MHLKQHSNFKLPVLLISFGLHAFQPRKALAEAIEDADKETSDADRLANMAAKMASEAGTGTSSLFPLLTVSTRSPPTVQVPTRSRHF